MKDRYKISDYNTFDLAKGGFVNRNGKIIGITAYQERFLKYLILNENSICIQNNINKYVYRGESVPKSTPNFYTQLLERCPELKDRISIHKVEYMDIGYQFNLSKHVKLMKDEMLEADITVKDLQEIGQTLIAENIDELQNILTPKHQTVLQILLTHHDKPLTYETIIQMSYELAEKETPPLKNTQDIIGICNDFLDTIPGFDEFLQPIYVNTVGYMYQKHPDDIETDSDKSNGDEPVRQIITTPPKDFGEYPKRNQLDKTYVYVGDDTYLNLKHQFALKYNNDQTVTNINLTPQMVSFLEPLIKNTPIAVSKVTLCWAVYHYYDKNLEENLYHIKKKIGVLIPALKKCITMKYGYGYTFHLPEETEIF